MYDAYHHLTRLQGMKLGLRHFCHCLRRRSGKNSGIGRFVVVLVVALAVSRGSANAQEVQRFEAQRVAMGVVFKIVGYSSEEAQARKAVEQAFARIEALNTVFSDYDPNSEASRIGAADQPAGWLDVSPEMYEVLRRSQAITAASDGAFDVTIGPLSQLWRRVRRSRELPLDSEIEAAKTRVSMRGIELDPTLPRVRIELKQPRLDFGGIAKGYAADEALKVLAEHGITAALVDASGDISFGDPPPDRESWFAEVAPLEPGGPPARRLAMSRGAVATSGDAWQYVELGGKRFSHIIDPRTGWALQGRHSVTVIAPDGTTADAWASALSVLGPEEGLKVAERTPKVEALFVVVEGEEVRTTETRGFARFDAKPEKELEPKDSRHQ